MKDIDLYKKLLLDRIHDINGILSNFINSNKSKDITELDKYSKLLNDIETIINSVSDIKELDSYRDSINNIDAYITKFISEFNKKPLSSREQALVDRGYEEDTVRRLASFDERLLDPITDEIVNRITIGCGRVDKPICMFLGGQPGCGKTTTSLRFKTTSFSKDGIVEIGIDNYRTYHPHYLEIEDEIRKHWEGKVPDENNSPGNDIADFTHNFAGIVTDILEDKISREIDNKRYNIVFEWGMRTPDGPIEVMRDLKNKGYRNIVDFIAVHKDISLEACKIRADVMNSNGHIIRRVPNYFHELCIDTLPKSCDEIYRRGYLNEDLIDDFVITTRDGKVVWNGDKKEYPGKVYTEYLNNPELSKEFTNHNEIALMAYKNESYGFNNNVKELFTEEYNNVKEDIDSITK